MTTNERSDQETTRRIERCAFCKEIRKDEMTTNERSDQVTARHIMSKTRRENFVSGATDPICFFDGGVTNLLSYYGGP